MTKSIPLTQGKFALVDDEDYEKINKYKWCYLGNGYACRTLWPSRKMVLMHREIANTPDGMFTDHINGDGLDNRRSNLRICTQAENTRNQRLSALSTSGYKGVHRWKRGVTKKWSAHIQINKKQMTIGYYATAEEAAHAYDEAAIKHHGEFAKLNFPKVLE